MQEYGDYRLSLPNMVRLGMAARDDGFLNAWGVLVAWAVDLCYLPLGEDSE